MSVAGKKKDEWVAITLCDFGDPNRREILRHHFSVDSAILAFKQIEKIYGRNRLTNGNGRVWQETRCGSIINDNDSHHNR
jgi:hypothetical protein